MKCRNKITVKVKENLQQTKTAAQKPEVRHYIMAAACLLHTRALSKISIFSGGLIIPLYLLILKMFNSKNGVIPDCSYRESPLLKN